MPDPFDSSRRKIAPANKHLADLKREVRAFLEQKNFYNLFTEPHPSKPDHIVQKLRVAKQIPDDWSEIVGDIVDNLRSALDHAIYSVAVASGRSNPRNAFFPFSGAVTRFEANLKGRC